LPTRKPVREISEITVASTLRFVVPREARYALAQAWQASPERFELVVLDPITNLAPFRVVPVLRAATSVIAGGQQMTVRIATNPNISPGGRQRELTNRLQAAFISQQGTIRQNVDEALATLDAPDPGVAAAHVTQAGTLRNFYSCGFATHDILLD
jgi:hypothetical protein